MGSCQRAGAVGEAYRVDLGSLELRLRLATLLGARRGRAGRFRVLDVRAGGVVAVESVDAGHARVWTSSVI